MKKKARRALRGAASFALALTTLWAVAAAAPTESFSEAARAVGGTPLPLLLLRFERGDLFFPNAMSFPAALALHVTPLLLPPPGAEEEPAREAEETPAAAPSGEKAEDSGQTEPRDEAPAEPQPVTVRDNGVPSTTLRPSDPSGYLVRGSVYVNNASAAPLAADDLSLDFSAVLTDEAPQVLIVHTHGCEAYTMPDGEEYEESDDHRTLDERYNVVRVGDEIARTLEDAGLGVVHDRTLHDYPSYSGSYNRSLATVEDYLARYPSIVYVFDVHRDAVADAEGNQYKLLCAEEPNAAQLELVIGSDGGGAAHDNWRENLKLACAVQSTLLADYPTLMRPIIVRNSRYNQHVTAGALLVEVGTAGNSLDEALAAARLFAAGFADTVKG